FKSLACQVLTDLFPVPATVSRLPKRIRGEIQHVWIDRREQNRLCAHDPKIGVAKRLRHDVLSLRGAPVVTRQLAAIDDVRIERVGDYVTIFLGCDRMPFTKSYFAVVAATGDTRRTAF